MRHFLSYLLVWSVECIPQKCGTAMRHNASVSKTPSRTFSSATQTVIKANAAAHRLLKPFAIRSFAQQWEFNVRALGHFHRIIIFFFCARTGIINMSLALEAASRIYVAAHGEENTNPLPPLSTAFSLQVLECTCTLPALSIMS